VICSYCGTENDKEANLCVFCRASLHKKRPQLQPHVYLEQCELPFDDLVNFHTYDLLVLLRLVRGERSKAYDLMRSVQKAPDGVLVSSDTLAFAEQEYRLYTKRMRVIEGILIDRMGYKPKRVDDKLLARLEEKMRNA
jgi:hypothetical protein